VNGAFPTRLPSRKNRAPSGLVADDDPHRRTVFRLGRRSGCRRRGLAGDGRQRSRRQRSFIASASRALDRGRGNRGFRLGVLEVRGLPLAGGGGSQRDPDQAAPAATAATSSNGRNTCVAGGGAETDGCALPATTDGGGEGAGANGGEEATGAGGDEARADDGSQDVVGVRAVATGASAVSRSSSAASAAASSLDRAGRSSPARHHRHRERRRAESRGQRRARATTPDRCGGRRGRWSDRAARRHDVTVPAGLSAPGSRPSLTAGTRSSAPGGARSASPNAPSLDSRSPDVSPSPEAAERHGFWRRCPSTRRAQRVLGRPHPPAEGEAQSRGAQATRSPSRVGLREGIGSVARDRTGSRRRGAARWPGCGADPADRRPPRTGASAPLLLAHRPARTR
jgi:hypothetical protein